MSILEAGLQFSNMHVLLRLIEVTWFKLPHNKKPLFRTFTVKVGTLEIFMLQPLF